jgi:uncharacterized membrane protein YbhN (UPF0104 family)
LPRGVGRLLGVIISLMLFGLAAIVIGRTFTQLRFVDLAAALAQTRGATICAALFLTGLSYAALTGYDFVALRQIGARAPMGAVGLASFVSNAFSFTLGFPLLTGAAVRYWVYARAALTARQIASIILVASLTFWLGMAGWLCVGLLVGATPLAGIDHLPAPANSCAGATLLAALVAYCVWALAAPRHLRFFGRALELPGPRTTLLQLTLGLADIGCAAAALYVLLPQKSSSLDFSAFAAIYVFAALVGAISHAPGGVGVFEAVMLNAVPAPSQEALFAALLLFRAIYYLIPFIIALVLLGAQGGVGFWAELLGGLRKGAARRSV